jgi:hypothetical protein
MKGISVMGIIPAAPLNDMMPDTGSRLKPVLAEDRPWPAQSIDNLPGHRPERQGATEYADSGVRLGM